MFKATKKHIIFFMLLSVVIVTTFNLMAATTAIIQHQVLKNESLSQILKHYGLKPLYGKSGFINLVTRSNKKNIKKNGNLIRVGAVIKIPAIGKVDTIVQKVPEIQQEQLKVVVNREPSDEYPYSQFSFGGEVASLNIDSNNDVNFGGSSVNALSNKGATANIAWSVFYDERFSFMGYAAYDYFTFTNDPALSMNRKNVTRLHFGAGAFYHYQPDIKFISNFSLRQISFLDVISPSNVNLETLSFPEMSLGLQKSLLAKKQFRLDLAAHASYLLAGSSGGFKGRPGYGAGSTLELIHKQKSLLINYDLRSTKINDIKNKETIIGLGMNFKI